MNLQFQPNEFGASVAPDSQQTNLFASVHHALRGRYIWAILLAATLGALGGFAGYRLKEPVYTASGLVQVHQRIPKVFRGIQENELLSRIDDEVAAEASKIGSQRVIENAADDPELLSAGWPSGSAGASLLKQALDVRHNRRQTIIEVAVTHTDPRLSMHGANAILRAYETLYGSESKDDANKRREILEAQRRVYIGQLDSSLVEAQGLSERYGTDDLTKLRDAKLAQQLEIDRLLNEIQFRILALENAGKDETAGSPDTGNSVSSNSGDYTAEQLASVDPWLQSLLEKRNELQATLKAKLETFGESHVEIRGIKQELSKTDTEISLRVSEILSEIEAGRLSLAEPGSQLTGNETLESLKARQESYRKEKEDVLAELREINSTRADISVERDKQDRLKRTIDELTREIEDIDIESAGFLNRGLTAIMEAGQPTEYSSDKRKQLAVLGGGGGVMMGIGIVWLFGLLRPSYRYIDELEKNAPLPVLGTLPDLTDPEQEQLAMASLSIHHLRNMLSLRAQRQPDRRPAYMITSARQGDGKTSLVLALGMSFASEGMRTVMLDADLIGRGLSRSLDLDGELGLTDVLGKDTIDGAVHSTQVKGLWIVPVGQPGGHRPEELAAQQLRRVVDSLRQEFDVILIDTGPLMGSLEANVMASIADETVLTIARGQDPRVVQATLNRLDQIGGKCAGLVFNRAAQHDLERSVSQVSFHSQSIRIESVPSGAAPRSRTKSDERQSSERRALVRAIMDQSSESMDDSTPGEWKNESA